MAQQSRYDPQTNCDPIEKDAARLEGKFGDLATTYAENRSEAAQLRGADADAEHWRDVANEIEDSDGSDE